ncbi:MAG: hypothetical protein IT440_13105, partial [Phycisphaeraceae bacterium]|nr:hypothetical protein [Phycisphaeraceae bacterium]
VTQPVAMHFTPHEPGDFVLTVRLAAVAGESSTANNARTLALKVEAEPIRVLMLEGTLRPEAAFLVDALKRDPDVDVISFTRTGGDASPAASAESIAAGAELLSPQRLDKVEVVLLGDVPAMMFDAAAWENLRQWVEKGGGLLVLGGYRNLGPQGLGATPLSPALPVELGSSFAVGQIDDSIHWRITGEGQRHPALMLSGDRTQDSQQWESLPALPGLVAVDQLKPAATVLAESDLTSPSGKPWPVLMVQPFGQGQCVLITLDTTWRWSRAARLAGQPDTLYARLWSQMVRWLARRDATDSAPALTVTTDQPSYPRGQVVTMEVRRNPAAKVTGNVIALDVRWPDGHVTPVGLEPTSMPDRWTAKFYPSQGGTFEATAAMSSESAVVATRQTQFLVEGSNLELQRSTPNPAALQQMTRATGGLYYDLDDDESLRAMADDLPAQPRVLEEMRRATLWNNPLLFAVFLLCVSVEWIVRRRYRIN